MRLKRLRRRGGGVVDRRGSTGFGGGTSRMGLPVGGGVIGGGAIGIVLLVVIVALQVCGGSSGGFEIPGLPGGLGTATGSAGATGPPPDDSLGDFVDAVTDDVQITWDDDIFAPAGREYRDTAVVLFADRTASDCGIANQSMGPFYCPADGTVYLEQSFFEELSRRFGAPGDFAQAYVIAHEIGHHIQSLLGIEAKVRQQQRANPDEANELSVRLELQADCFAGVWGHSAAARGVLEDGDLEEALGAAEAVGDDTLQQQTQGRVRPDTFTHGTSAQRVRWLRRGLDSGDPSSCDTFKAREL